MILIQFLTNSFNLVISNISLSFLPYTFAAPAPLPIGNKLFIILPNVPGIEKAWTPKIINTNKNIMNVIRIINDIIKISCVIPIYSMDSNTLCF